MPEIVYKNTGIFKTQFIIDEVDGGLKVTRMNHLTKKVNTMVLPITREEFDKMGTGPLIQDVFPNLNNMQREFLLTGFTQEEWDQTFGEEDEDE